MCGILHGDIKPDNFLFGTKNKSSKIYMIDYGMSKKYQHENGQHVLEEKIDKFSGNLRFSSLNSYQGYTISRRDDLESFVYIVIYLLNG